MRLRSSSSGTEGLPAKVAVDEGPASADDEAAVLQMPVPAPEFEQPQKPLPKKLLTLLDELGADREF